MSGKQLWHAEYNQTFTEWSNDRVTGPFEDSEAVTSIIPWSIKICGFLGFIS